MRIIERYPARYRMLVGRGAWKLLHPVRAIIAGIYRLWLFLPGRVREPHHVSSFREQLLPPDGRPRVISIGNLEVGGGGKTPCTVRIAEGIAARGGRAVVVARGYHSAAERCAPCVVPAGHDLPEEGAGSGFVLDEALIARFRPAPGGPSRLAAILGDETLLYRERGIPVVIDPVRTRGAELARHLFSPTHILLDDAFQNRSIAKDVEIVLLDAERPFGDGHLLPLGTLREIPEAVGRADVVLFTRSRGEGVPPDAQRFVAGKPVFFARHEACDIVNRRGEIVPLAQLAGRECVLFSGIARPGSFEQTVASFGARPIVAFRFIDHHEYSGTDVKAILRAGREGTSFVTTEKDWHRALGLFPDGVSLFALRIAMRIDDIDGLLDLVFSSSS
jgi:tetraacyldisaccharide 4'-kinase